RSTRSGKAPPRSKGWSSPASSPAARCSGWPGADVDLQARDARGLGDEVARYVLVHRKPLVTGLADLPGIEDLLADHRHFEVREGDVPVQSRKVAAAQAGVQVAHLRASQEAGLGSH